MVDYVTPGYLEDLTARIDADKAIQEEDVAPFFRDFSQKFDGKKYMVTLDGDFQMAYYRTDVLEKLGKQPPKTWDDYIAIAKAAQGMDMNGDGKADYGSCISKKRNAQAYWSILSIAGGLLQAQGTKQGVFFDTANMQPLTAPTDSARRSRSIRRRPNTGRLTRSISTSATRASSSSPANARLAWTGATSARSPSTRPNPKVNDKVGAVIMPGSTEVVDRTTGKLVACDATTCPYAIDGVNHAPFAAFGGWGGGINAHADAKVKDAAFAFLSYMSQPAQSNVDVTIGKTGFNPYRVSQFKNMTLAQGRHGEPAAKSYLGAIETA